MALIVVFIDVFEVRIERVVVEVQIGIGIRRSLPHVRDVADLRYSALRGVGCLWPFFTASGIDSVQS